MEERNFGNHRHEEKNWREKVEEEIEMAKGGLEKKILYNMKKKDNKNVNKKM